MASFSGRYARALFQTGRKEGDNREIRYGELLTGFIKGFEESPKLRSFLAGPNVDKQTKIEFLQGVFPDKNDASFLNFLKVLVDKDRMGIIEYIGLDYRRLELDSRNIREAIIESAFPLDGETVEAVKTAFRKKTGAREIRATVRIVPELIGGLRVIIGSTVYDGTTRSELDRLHDIMKQ